jgi:hypothetical protein
MHLIEGLVGSGPSPEELQHLRDELLVALEHAAMAGVWVNPERGVWETVGEAERSSRWEHPVVLTVCDEHGVRNRAKVHGVLSSRPVNRDQLRSDSLR